MVKNYLKITWRNLLKHRTFSVINIAGLSFSVAFCLLVLFYMSNEQSYDSFHVKKGRLFRAEMRRGQSSVNKKTGSHFFSFLTKEDDEKNQLAFPLIVGLDMQNTFPEIKSITRFQTTGNLLVKINSQLFKEKQVIYSDYNFFNNFSFPLIKGNTSNAFNGPQTVVLSETTAKKYFGNLDPIGKTLSLAGDSSRLFTVSAVAADAPANSSIQYSIVFPVLSDPGYDENIKDRFNHASHMLVVELNQGVSEIQFENKMNQWVKKYYVERELADNGQYYEKDAFKNFSWHLRSLANCHYNASSPWGHYTNAKNIYQLVCLVIVILLIASLNYVLIVVSGAAARVQEVGIRKVMGANRRSVIFQFWIETQIIVAIAVLAGLLLTQPLLPLFNKMIGAGLDFHMISWRTIIPAALLLCFTLGIIAGYYPALIISKMKPLSVIKSFSTFKINPRFSKILIVLQYTSCVVLMIAAFIINRQMRYIASRDLGFDKEQILMVSNPTWDYGFTTRVNRQLETYAKSQPAITQYSSMGGSLTGSYNHNAFMLNGEKKWLSQLAVDYGYFDMLGLQFVLGRPFSKEILSDTSKKTRPAVVNETLFNLLGKDARLNVYNETIRSTIIGVVKDYHFESLSKKIEPEQHVLLNGYAGNFMFKIKAGQTQPAIAGIQKEWKNITGNYPFEYTFLDENIAQMYEPELRWQKTIQVSCFFAIFIACMGLFGLSAINAVNRTKEIGIRKILGASVKDIVGTLSADFIIMVSLAILIASPIAWWMMTKWLEDFAYRIDISWWMFIVVGIIALLIALTATGFQAVKAALANPVDSLRTE